MDYKKDLIVKTIFLLTILQTSASASLVSSGICFANDGHLILEECSSHTVTTCEALCDSHAECVSFTIDINSNNGCCVLYSQMPFPNEIESNSCCECYSKIDPSSILPNCCAASEEWFCSSCNCMDISDAEGFGSCPPGMNCCNARDAWHCTGCNCNDIRDSEGAGCPTDDPHFVMGIVDNISSCPNGYIAYQAPDSHSCLAAALEAGYDATQNGQHHLHWSGLEGNTDIWIHTDGPSSPICHMWDVPGGVWRGLRFNPTGKGGSSNFIGQPICEKVGDSASHGQTVNVSFQNVDLDFQVRGWTVADFDANKDALKAHFASVFGVNANLISLSATPFRRRLFPIFLFQSSPRNSGPTVDFYVRISAPDTSMAAINSAIANPALFELDTFESGVSFELVQSENPGLDSCADDDALFCDWLDHMTSSEYTGTGCDEVSDQDGRDFIFGEPGRWTMEDSFCKLFIEYYSDGAADDDHLKCDLSIPTANTPSEWALAHPEITKVSDICQDFCGTCPGTIPEQPDCDLCVSEFASLGGCDCLNSENCDADALISPECESCGMEASLRCGGNSCPSGFVEMQGQTDDDSWVTYTDGIEACAEACDLQAPNHQNLPARDCNSFQYSPTVNANGRGQCHRFADSGPEDTSSNRGPDFVFCSREPRDIQSITTKTLSKIGDGRCTVDGARVELMGYMTRTTETDCLASCEADPDCVAAMPAYDYYCQLYKTADVTGVIDGVDTTQSQWSCHTKKDPEAIVFMDFAVTGVDAAGFSAMEDEFKTALASELGLLVGQIDISRTPFRRRLSEREVGEDGFFTIYTRIRAAKADMPSINEVTNNSSILTDALGREFELLEFEVVNSEVQPFTTPETVKEDAETVEDAESSVSMTTFLIVVGALVILILVLGVFLVTYCQRGGSNNANLKRRPSTRRTEDDVEMPAHPELGDVASFGGDEKELEVEWQKPTIA